MDKKLLLEKYIKVAVKKALKEQEEQQQKAERALYLVYRFPGLKKIITDLMTSAFGHYISDINIIAPRPTTFKINLINGQDYTIKYLGKGKFNVKIAGKQYHPDNLGELERASQAIADLLELNYAPSEGKEQKSNNPESPTASELSADLSGEEIPTPPAETPEAPENIPQNTPEKEEEK